MATDSCYKRWAVVFAIVLWFVAHDSDLRIDFSGLSEVSKRRRGPPWDTFKPKQYIRILLGPCCQRCHHGSLSGALFSSYFFASQKIHFFSSMFCSLPLTLYTCSTVPSSFTEDGWIPWRAFDAISETVRGEDHLRRHRFRSGRSDTDPAPGENDRESLLDPAQRLTTVIIFPRAVRVGCS